MLISTLSSCGSHKPVEPILVEPVEKDSPIIQQPVTPAASMQQVTDLLLLAKQDGEFFNAIEGLQKLAGSAATPVKEEAAFRRVQLLLEHQQPDADIEAKYLLMTYPDHALVPYTYFWLATWWKKQEPSMKDDGMSADNDVETIFSTPDPTFANHTLDALTASLRHPSLTPELMQRDITLGYSVLTRATLDHITPWYFAAAHVDKAHRDYWMQLISSDLSMEELQRLHDKKIITPQGNDEVYLHFARQQLMSGNMNTLHHLANLLNKDAPDLPLTQQINSWFSGSMRPIKIGVLLPLTGRYAHFGQEALNGIRLAISTQQSPIQLYIEDTHQKQIQTAYQQLQAEQVDWIIGPLLSKQTAALAPILSSTTPVLSLSMDNSLAATSPALFIHNLAPATQARALATYAFSQGIRRIAVVHGTSSSEEREANAFIETFAALGGDIADDVMLDSAGIDHRHTLNQLREESDDEILLHALMVDRALFMPDQPFDIHLPVNMDALYLAMNGKHVSELAGQLAYVDIRHIPLLGSNRWMDGHLLDDRGRNLSTARFIQSEQQSSNLLQRFHEVWGEGKPSKLLMVAYDSAQIAMLIGSRLALQGEKAMEALHDHEGFPSESGHVHFNNQGFGEKIFPIYRIQRGTIVPAQ